MVAPDPVKGLLQGEVEFVHYYRDEVVGFVAAGLSGSMLGEGGVWYAGKELRG